MALCPAQVALSLIALLLLLPAAWSATFTMTNNCGYTVWPGLLSGAGTAPLSTTGFALAQGASAAVDAPTGWSGRMWARTLCAEDATGRFTCATGDCGSGTLQCNGGGAAPPTSLVEFTLDGSGGMDFFDVSLVDGYNLPMLIVPQGAAAAGASTAVAASSAGGPKCMATGCLVDLNEACPADLRVTSSTGVAGAGTAAVGSGSGSAVACKSACEAFGSPQYCCSGAYGSPSTCRPSTYSQFFKSACPRAYSYAYDDSTSTFTCAAGTNYAITFCPSTTSGKYTDPQAAGVPQTNGTMVYNGGEQFSTNGGAAIAARASAFLLAVAVAVALI